MFNKSINDLLASISGFLKEASTRIQQGNQEQPFLAGLNEVRKALGDLELLLPSLKDEDETPIHGDPGDHFSADDF